MFDEAIYDSTVYDTGPPTPAPYDPSRPRTRFKAGGRYHNKR